MSLNTQEKDGGEPIQTNIRPEIAANKATAILSTSSSKEIMQRDILEVISLVNSRTESCNNLKR